LRSRLNVDRRDLIISPVGKGYAPSRRSAGLPSAQCCWALQAITLTTAKAERKSPREPLSLLIGPLASGKLANFWQPVVRKQPCLKALPSTTQATPCEQDLTCHGQSSGSTTETAIKQIIISQWRQNPCPRHPLVGGSLDR
jgi:hypothetical protein